MSLKDKVAIVTGGTRGIGREIALSFATEGANVVICGRSQELLDKVGSELESKGSKTLALKADVQSADDVHQVAQNVLDTYGRIDILVNNAGVTRDNLTLRLSEDDWNVVLNINLKGTFLFTKAVMKPMIKQRSGKIVNVSSVVGMAGNAGQANYSASKAGVIGFTKSVARELASRNICVNAVAPGFIDTEMTGALAEDAQKAALADIPMKRFGSASEIADAVLFLVSERSNYITGQVLVVDGGMVM